MLMIQYLLCHLSSGRFSESQKGATLIEYVLIVAVIAIAVFAGSEFGVVDSIQGVFSSASTCITDPDSCSSPSK